MYTVQRESKDVALGLKPENRYTPMNRSSGTRQARVCDARNIMGVGAMVLCTGLLTASALFSATPDLEHRIDALVDASGPVGARLRRHPRGGAQRRQNPLSAQSRTSCSCRRRT